MPDTTPADAFVVDLAAAGDLVPPYVFGHNLEHTRSCVHNGLSAQIVRNRKFAGKPQASLGIAAEWEAVGGEGAHFWMDYNDSYTRRYDPPTSWYRPGPANELHSQRMQSYTDGVPRGIAQDRLALRGGVAHELRVALRTRAPLPVRVSLVDEKGATVFESTLDHGPGEWRLHRFECPASDADTFARLEITIDRRGALDVGAVSLLPVDSFHGMRADVVALLEEIGTTMLRWPGGNFAGDYRWKDGLLPVDQRGPLDSHMEVETMPHSFGYDFHEIGTDEFIALCKEIGAEPFMTINLGWDTPEDCAAWVEYCNGPADSTWGRLRAASGHPEPYDVKYWSLGNEFGYDHMEGPKGPGAYAQKARKCADLMKEVDAGLTLCTSGTWWVDEWFTEALAPLAETVDHLSYHNYTRRPVDFLGESSDDEFAHAVRAPATVLEALAEVRRKADAVTGGKRVAIAFDEWNVWEAWYRIPGPVECIHNASMLNMLCREATSLDISTVCFFEPVNEGAIIVEPFSSRIAPGGMPFALLSAHRGGKLVALPAQDGAADLDVTASLHDDGGRLVVTIVNRDPRGARTAALTLRGGTAVAAEGTMLSSADYLPTTEVAERAADISREGDDLSIEMPAHSVARVVISLG